MHLSLSVSQRLAKLFNRHLFHITKTINSIVGTHTHFRFADLFLSSRTSSPTFNFADQLHFTKRKFPNQLKELISAFFNHDRYPALQVSPLSSPSSLPSYLQFLGFELYLSFSYMYLRNNHSHYSPSPSFRLNPPYTFRHWITDTLRIFAVPRDLWSVIFQAFFELASQEILIPYYIVHENTPVGTISLLEAEHLRGIYNFGIFSKYRRQGYARASMNLVLTTLFEDKETIVLQVTQQSPAHQLYLSLGFKEAYPYFLYVLPQSTDSPSFSAKLDDVFS